VGGQDDLHSESLWMGWIWRIMAQVVGLKRFTSALSEMHTAYHLGEIRQALCVVQQAANGR
jgi:hypothetical protein